jgi:hypothetical protein
MATLIPAFNSCSMRMTPGESRAVSFHKEKDFVNIMGEKSLSDCNGSMTISPEYVESDGSQDGEICRGMTQTYFGIILFENYVFNPVKAIFNTPMTANTTSKFLCGLNQATNVTNYFMIRFTASCSGSFNSN